MKKLMMKMKKVVMRREERLNDDVWMKKKYSNEGKEDYGKKIEINYCLSIRNSHITQEL